MILVTVGTQASFDRFIRIIDKIAVEIGEKIVVQSFKGCYEPKNVKAVDFLPPDEFNKLFNEARLIVSHAGMGTIISAMQQEKPIIVFPRIAALGEHRNEHQMATAKQMAKMKYVYVAFDEEQLRKLMFTPDLKPLHRLDVEGSQSLIDSLAEFIDK